MEITKGYEPKQNEQTDQTKNLPDTTDRWKQLAKEQAETLEKVTAERDELQVKNQKMNEFIQEFQERTHKLKMEKQKLFFENHRLQEEMQKSNVEIQQMTAELSEMRKRMWDEISQMFLVGSLSGIALLGDIIRGYMPVNLILLFGFINVGIMLLRVYLQKKFDYL